MSSGSGGGGSSNTVTQVQQIPQFEQDFAQNNQSLAQSLGSQNYPLYQGPLVAGQTPLQQGGQAMAGAAAGAYQPDLTAAENTTNAALANGNPNAMTPAALWGVNNLQQTGMGNATLNPANAGTVQQFMSPYVQAALAPQIADLQTQLGQEQNQIGAQATQAGAFGDARQGVQSALANHYANEDLSGLVANGYNTAFGNALNTIGNQEALGSNQLGLANSILTGQQAVQGQEQGAQLQGAGQLANLAGLAQSLGIGGANALYNAGTQQQQQQQTELNTAYQQFQNQMNWPFQMLNVQESALSNSPYSISNSVTLPEANGTAQGLGTFANLAGSLGSLFSGSGSKPFGGSAFV